MMRLALVLLLATTVCHATTNNKEERHLKKSGSKSGGDFGGTSEGCSKAMEAATMFGIDPMLIGSLVACNGNPADRTEPIMCFQGTPAPGGQCQSENDCSNGNMCIVYAGNMLPECGTEATITGHGFTNQQVKKMCDGNNISP